MVIKDQICGLPLVWSIAAIRAAGHVPGAAGMRGPGSVAKAMASRRLFRSLVTMVVTRAAQNCHCPRIEKEITI